MEQGGSLMLKLSKWLKQYFKKCHLEKRINPLIPILAMALTMIAFATSGSHYVGIFVDVNIISNLGAFFLLVYSLVFFYHYGNQKTVRATDWFIIGLGYMAIALLLIDNLSWHSIPFEELMALFIFVSFFSLLIGQFYKDTRNVY